jgi:lipopolysaccharide export system permease protein
VYKQSPGQFRAELHDRLIAPIYPFVFTVMCFAILGAPRTSRQSREMSMVMALSAALVLRLIGFACNVLAAQSVVAVFVLYGSVFIALALGLYAIGRGILIEPPSFVMQPFAVFSRLTQRFSQRLAPT